MSASAPPTAGDRVGLTSAVATALGVGRRRIYDIVNVLESLDVVQKDRTSAYSWLGISKLPECVERLTNAKPIVPLLVEDAADRAPDKENAWGSTVEKMQGNLDDIEDHDATGGRRVSIGSEKSEGRKEKSIRELSTKFVGLFIQAVNLPGLDGTISLEQAARSLLVFEAGTAEGVEPDAGAMKTKVRHPSLERAHAASCLAQRRVQLLHICSTVLIAPISRTGS